MRSSRRLGEGSEEVGIRHVISAERQRIDWHYYRLIALYLLV